eukprot:gene304-393_t
MWLIGIRSGIITLLAFIAYTLLVSLLNLHATLLGKLGYLVFGVGIYSALYYYKHANRGVISFRQGLQVGMIAVLFVSCVTSSLTYIMLNKYGTHLTPEILERLKKTLQHLFGQDPDVQQALPWIETLLTPACLACLNFLSVFLLGNICTVLVALCARTRQDKSSI